MDNIVCGICSVSQIIQFRRCIFSKNIYIFCHLKLEIALAIPASNDEKYNWNNSAGQGLRQDLLGFASSITVIWQVEDNGDVSYLNELALYAYIRWKKNIFISDF